MSNKKRVLHIFFNGIGGVMNVALSIPKSDVEREFEHAILAIGNTKMNIADAIAAYPKNSFYQVKLITKKGFYDFAAYFAFLKSLWRARPNCILLHTPTYLPFVLFYKLFHRKLDLIMLEHNSVILKRKYTFFLTRLGGFFCKKIGFQTEASYQEHIKILGKKGGQMLQRKGVVIPNAIDDYFINKAVKERNPKHTQLVMTSRLTPGKDHVTVVRAVAKLIAEGYQISLMIIGEGVTYDEIYDEVCKLDIKEHVHFLGYVLLSEIKATLQESDICVLSTQGETMSISMLEAMAMRLPVVGSDVFGVGTYIKDGEDGLLFEYQNVASLYTKLKQLIDDKELYVKIQQNAFNRILQNHTYPALFKSYRKLIVG